MRLFTLQFANSSLRAVNEALHIRLNPSRLESTAALAATTAAYPSRAHLTNTGEYNCNTGTVVIALAHLSSHAAAAWPCRHARQQGLGLG